MDLWDKVEGTDLEKCGTIYRYKSWMLPRCVKTDEAAKDWLRRWLSNFQEGKT